MQVGRALVHPEDQQVAAGGDVADLVDHREVAGGVDDPDPDQVEEGQRDPGPEQAGRAEEGDRLDPHHLERVDLVGDPHRPDLGDDPGPDLGGEDVAEGVGQPLAQVAVGGEEAGQRGGADRAVEVGALEAALEAEDEAEGPDDQRRAEDQDPRLAQPLAEELEDPARVDQPRDPGRRSGRSPRRSRASRAGRRASRSPDRPAVRGWWRAGPS